ncbi:MAG: hypothetical protein EA350_00585 [Gemmatimonadales bacterium]|nr:MAG: hypothetical protein EA350_00585 [Gemmatimonadales bacterium]
MARSWRCRKVQRAGPGPWASRGGALAHIPSSRLHRGTSVSIPSSGIRFAFLSLLAAAPLVLGCAPTPASGQEATTVFVVVTSPDNMTQGMALVLANQSLDQGAEVRVLLCGPGANLGLSEQDGESLQPRDITPGQLLARLIANDVKVDVCAIFLPNTRWSESDLREGVGIAQPPEVTAFMLQPGVRYFTF